PARGVGGVRRARLLPRRLDRRSGSPPRPGRRGCRPRARRRVAERRQTIAPAGSRGASAALLALRRRTDPTGHRGPSRHQSDAGLATARQGDRHAPQRRGRGRRLSRVGCHRVTRTTSMQLVALLPTLGGFVPMTLPAILENRLSIPVVASPMFIASGPDLVIAQCKAGVVGSFPALNARPASMLKDWLQQITEELDGTDAAPFAVNQIVHRSNNRLEEDMATLVEFEVPIVITSLGARPEINEAVHSYGGIVLHDVINDRFAHK